MRLMGKVNHSSLLDPFGTGNSNYPAATAKNQEHSTDVVGELTTGAQQQGAQHRARRLRLLRHQPVEPHVLVAALGGRQRHHQRRAEL